MNMPGVYAAEVIGCQNTPQLRSSLVFIEHMHFRILKVIAIGGFLTALESIKFVFSRGSTLDPAGELTALPQTT